MDAETLFKPVRPTTQEVVGFVTKCASAGLGEDQAALLLAQATLRMQSPAFREGFENTWNAAVTAGQV